VKWQRALRAGAPDGKRRRLPDLAPLSINLDLTTACNYKPATTASTGTSSTARRSTRTRSCALDRAMAERGLRSVILIGGGEPTLYPGFVPFVQFLKELGSQVAVVSNGSRGDRSCRRRPTSTGRLDPAVARLGQQRRVPRMHNPSSATLTLDEICSWMPQIKAVNPALQLGFSFVITWKGGSRGAVKVVENIHEMVMAARRARTPASTTSRSSRSSSARRRAPR
jgi:hypothetical protein